MKLGAWHSHGMFPLNALEEANGLFSLWFRDDEGDTPSRVLLRGISGTGKSTLLRSIHTMFSTLPALLSGTDFTAIQGNAALRLEGLLPEPVLLCLAPDAEFWDAVLALHPDALALGLRSAETVLPESLVTALRARFAVPASAPNVLLLADDSPEDNLPDTVLSVDLFDIASYIHRAGGYAPAMAALKTAFPERFPAFLLSVNNLLFGKAIDSEGGFQVLTRQGGHHAPELLSAGERHILRMMLAVGLALHPGGILLVDEPESHLHPSQTLGVLTSMEAFAARGDGQMILSSHLPEVWRRYENLGLAITLEEGEA